MDKLQKALKIKIMLKEKGITQRALAQKIGESHNQISNRLNGDRPISVEFINKLRPVLGDGVLELLEDDEPQTDSPTRPRVMYNSQAGSLTEVLDGVTLEQCEQVPVIPVFPNYTFTIRVTGESMEPFIRSGDEVACLRVNESSFLQWGRIHVLDTAQGIVIKKIYDAGTGIKCVSLNENYPPFVIPKGDIYSYNLVVGLLRL